MKYNGEFDVDPLARQFIDGFAEEMYIVGYMPGAMEYVAPGFYEAAESSIVKSPFTDENGRVWTEIDGRWVPNKLHPELWS